MLLKYENGHGYVFDTRIEIVMRCDAITLRHSCSHSAVNMRQLEELAHHFFNCASPTKKCRPSLLFNHFLEYHLTLILATIY